jgi:hypothetical protein
MGGTMDGTAPWHYLLPTEAGTVTAASAAICLSCAAWRCARAEHRSRRSEYIPPRRSAVVVKTVNEDGRTPTTTMLVPGRAIDDDKLDLGSPHENGGADGGMGIGAGGATLRERCLEPPPQLAGGPCVTADSSSGSLLHTDGTTSSRELARLQVRPGAWLVVTGIGGGVLPELSYVRAARPGGNRV